MAGVKKAGLKIAITSPPVLETPRPEEGEVNTTGANCQEVKVAEAVDESMGIQPDPEKNRFPYCIVWTPIPFLT